MNIEHLFARTAHGIKPGLDVISELLRQLGNPHENLKIIHVAGTNGKGSVCAMIESVLRASGFKTGLYTSPHLFRFNERFRIAGKEISDVELENLIVRVEAAAGHITTRPPTFFEISTAMAFEYFRRQNVDYAVIEVGMGGRWDATNVVQPLISIITRIDLDHAEYLGSDIQNVAREKAGIIKTGAPVICGPMPVEAESIIYQEAAEKNVPILGSEAAAFIHVLETRRTDQLIDIEASGSEYNGIRLPLAGTFQIENCGIAVAALEDIADLAGIRLEMKKGLEAVKWPGRFQLLQMKPPVIYDGAHNPAGARALKKSIEQIYPKFENGFVFSFMRDKDVTGILETVASLAGKAWAYTLPGDRAMSAGEIIAAGKTAGMQIELIEHLNEALDWANAGKKRLVCFTGSLYLPEQLRTAGIME
ncbi:MAG: folylpolyglutamate synthase/dihydrofolate synthase family protein [Kiritimatiellales bacterium]